MATFCYYNPKTNTIERRIPSHASSFQVPYLLNLQPQDLNYAINNANNMRSNPSYVEPLQSNPLSDYDYKIVEPLRLSKPQLEKENRSLNIPNERERAPIFSSSLQVPSNNEFLVLEDLHEEDLPSLPKYTQPVQSESKKFAQKNGKIGNRTAENVKLAVNKQEVPKRKSQQQKPIEEEEEAKGEFNLMKPEDFIKYKPEDYSINERILNAKYVEQEQMKTKKFIMNRIGNDINELEKLANGFEKELQKSEQETKDIEEKTKKMWEEIERKKFEMKAKEILNGIDRAIEIKEEPKQDDGIANLLAENQALFDEIDKVLEHEEEQDQSYSFYRETGTLGKKRPISTGLRETNKGFSSKIGISMLDQKLGRKNIVKPISEEKTKGATRLVVGKNTKKKGSTTKNDFVFKNPKKVEEALQKAKQIADLYE